ncbi:MAG: SDR family NAD(P)-dependent oxidoreductase [Saprospiraceae bacterium]|nr:SDR family NAD(P)-dependent oxidoreductase [Saprospiraceae bacterium]
MFRIKHDRKPVSNGASPKGNSNNCGGKVLYKLSPMQHAPKQYVYTLITGASSGLGKALAFECASRNMNLILVALPHDGLSEVQQELLEKFSVKIRIYEIDLADTLLFHDFIDTVQYLQIDCIINNVGVGGTLKFKDALEDDINKIIDLNVRTTSLVTYHILPELIRQREAHIINIGSLLAGYPVAYKTVYPASKSFVYSFSLGLQEELKGTSVYVSVALPGPMKTNPEVSCRLMKKQGRLAKAAVLSPQDVAKIIMDESFRYRSLIIPGWVNKLYWFVMKIVPLRFGVPFLSDIYRKELPQLPQEPVVGQKELLRREV